MSDLKIIKPIPTAACLLLLANAAWAGAGTFSGMFDGQEPSMPPSAFSCPDSGPLGFIDAGDFSVTANGVYNFADAGELLARDVVASVYQGSFNPDNPAQNRIAQVDGGAKLELQAGQTYRLVVQQSCGNQAGVYAVNLNGPGTINGSGVVTTPAWRTGNIGAQAQLADFGYGQVAYSVGPEVSVTRTGLHRIADLGVLTGLDTVIHVYRGAFDSQNPDARRIATVDDAGTVLLEAGQNYRFVNSVAVPGSTGAWRFELFPPGNTPLNPGLSGAWANSDTNGQGFLLEVYPDLRLVFVAWFTFDLELPPPGEEALIGAPGQRWMTATGRYAPGSSSLDLNVQLTSGGIFDDSPPLVQQQNDYGTLTLAFADCKNATLDYDLPAGPVSGRIPLKRIVQDNVALCAQYDDGPGVITN